MTLAEFLAARLDEDEAGAKAAAKKRPGLWRVLGDKLRSIVYGNNRDLLVADGPGEVAEHIARHDPARVLREAGAGRQILALHVPMWPEDPGSVTCTRCGLAWPCATLRALAAVHDDHPDYALAGGR